MVPIRIPIFTLFRVHRLMNTFLMSMKEEVTDIPLQETMPTHILIHTKNGTSAGLVLVPVGVAEVVAEAEVGEVVDQMSLSQSHTTPPLELPSHDLLLEYRSTTSLDLRGQVGGRE